jgi:hypothetical protein
MSYTQTGVGYAAFDNMIAKVKFTNSNIAEEH